MRQAVELVEQAHHLIRGEHDGYVHPAPRAHEPFDPLEGTPEHLFVQEDDNVETLYGALDDGALAMRLPKHARKELEVYLDCGLLCRGLARVHCASCRESRLVAFSCKGRGFCWTKSGVRYNDYKEDYKNQSIKVLSSPLLDPPRAGRGARELKRVATPPA